MFEYYFFVSQYQEPITGGHKRYKRLLDYLIETGVSVVNVAPFKIHEQNVSNIKLNHFLGNKLISLQICVNIIFNFRRFLEYRKENSVVIVFGETTLLAAYLISIISDSKISAAVRSNIFKRHQIKKKNKSLVKGLVNDIRFNIRLFILKFIYKRCEQITFQTEISRDGFVKHINVKRDKSVIINNDIPTEFESRAINKYSDVPEKLLFIGNNSYIKGFDLLCDILNSELSNKFKKVTIIGIKKGVDYGINFDGEIEIIERTKNIQKYMYEHDLLIIPSREDQFPNVVLEALAIKLPIIGSSVDGIKYMLDNEFLLFVPDKFNSIEECINRVTTVEGYRKCSELIKQRRELFRFDWSQEYLKTVNSLLY